MTEETPPSQKLVERVIQLSGPSIFEKFMLEKFGAEMLELNYYSQENAHEWIDIKQFMNYVAKNRPVDPTKQSPSALIEAKRVVHASLSSDSHPITPVAHSGGSGIRQRMPTSITPSLPPTKPPAPRVKIEPIKLEPDLTQDFIEVSSDDSIPAKSTKTTKSKKRKMRRRSSSGGSDSDTVEIVREIKTKKRKRKKNRTTKGADDERVIITSHTKVNELKTITQLPSTWTIYDGAYLLDLTDDPREWIDGKGDLMSMAAIIKSQDQDSWTQSGSGGHTQANKCPKVAPLNDAQCQVLSHKCGGVYHCDQLDMSLLDGHERYAPDEEDMKDLFKAEREVNLAESSSIHARAVSFYKDAMKQKCRAHNGTCAGEAVFRKYKGKSHDGKAGFIGCSLWVLEKGNDHRFMPIPRDVDEKLVKELFDSPDGSFSESVDTKQCARVLHTRHGGRGQQECHYSHIKDGKVVKGKLVHRPCNATIKIFSPLDRTDRRAIVYLTGPHNHPQWPATKVSRDGKDQYAASVIALGPSHATVQKCDMDGFSYNSAPATREIFGGKNPFEADSALLGSRGKRTIIKKIKNQANPHGNGLEGVIHLKQKDDELPLKDRYIHSISVDGFNMIVTMVPGLADRIHLATSTLHDNTYKRVYGDWKEWEVVIWDYALNMRVTVARVYCTQETREAFEKLWTSFWDIVEKVTGKPVQFKFMDGAGLAAIIVDGCKPQANALGDALKKRIAFKKASGTLRIEIEETDPQVLVQYILRTCEIHLERKLDDLAKTLPKDDMDRVRGFPFLETCDEVDEFVAWCEASSHKALKDWIVDKKSCPWFIPSLNRFMSKIPRTDWILTPGHTNLNESAHPFTNQHTGINLQIAEAITEARKLDMDVLSKIQNIYEACVLPNAHNTQAERDRANRRRQESRAAKRSKQEETVDEIHEVRDKIKELTQVTKDAAAQKKELREKEKALQQVVGLKRSPAKKNTARGKHRIPTDNDIAPDSDNELDSSQPELAENSLTVEPHTATVAFTSTTHSSTFTSLPASTRSAPLQQQTAHHDLVQNHENFGDGYFGHPQSHCVQYAALTSTASSSSSYNNSNPYSTVHRGHAYTTAHPSSQVLYLPSDLPVYAQSQPESQLDSDLDPASYWQVGGDNTTGWGYY
ncbi:hypothetical protein CPC08DRAFT_728578 [Agrocybe pediades]|nr:hypothetical protein CPC08DRAFT_728578 [Agrocybe pediades]